MLKTVAAQLLVSIMLPVSAAAAVAAVGTVDVVVAVPNAFVVADAVYLVLYACLFSSYVLNGLTAIASD